MAKSLIAYYSHSGQNYRDAEVTDLTTGNTRIVAEKIAELTGSELFRIHPVKAYPENYRETLEIARKELGEHARPPLAETVQDIGAYDMVYLGYPIWWGVMPMPVLTFLDSYDFSGKKIAPFCTHEGSGLGMSERYIRQACPKATLLPGLAITGDMAGQAEGDIKDWLKELGVAS